MKKRSSNSSSGKKVEPDINDLPHHFIYKHQEQYIMAEKENLLVNKCIVILDFAENYTFIVQDTIQSFNWNNAQATLQSFVVYWKNNNDELMHTSLACISDLLQHDVNAVYAFQYTIIHEFIKNELSQITNMNYFSDGQYKNHKNFTNFFHHVDVFHISAEWHFFATSHGKNACDSIGVTIKRLAAYSSLQKVTAGQTTEFCI